MGGVLAGECDCGVCVGGGGGRVMDCVSAGYEWVR